MRPDGETLPREAFPSDEFHMISHTGKRFEGGGIMEEARFSLRAVDRVEILTLIDNYVDVLLRSNDIVTRPPLAKGGTIPRDALLAEHGLSQLVTVSLDGESHSFLFDTGYSPIGVPHNLSELGQDLTDIEAIILSHGHMDHTGALLAVLEDLSRPIPLVLHPEAFHWPRYFGLDDGRKLLFPRTLDREELKGAGAMIVESEGPVLLGDDTVLVTGEVERVTPFEKGLPNALLERDGKEEKDPIRDDQSLVVNIKDKGLVIISGCAHAGIVNTVLYGRKLTGIDRVHTIIGGFHLSGPAFEPIIEKTIEEFKKMDPEVLVPMHCTGWKAIGRFSEAFPGAFVLNSVGSKFTIS